jgi:hypothetical protein
MEQIPEAATPKAVVVDQGSLFSHALVRDKRGD